MRWEEVRDSGCFGSYMKIGLRRYEGLYYMLLKVRFCEDWEVIGRFSNLDGRYWRFG